MALRIRDPKVEELAEAVAELTGETKSEAIQWALKERLERLRRERAHRPVADELHEIALRCAALPVLDDRPADEILGFDEVG